MKQTHEKTSVGPIKRPKFDFVGYEETNGGPMKRNCLTLIGYEKTLRKEFSSIFIYC